VSENTLIPPKLLMILELLPSCGMSFYKAALRVGYRPSYARKISSKFAYDERLPKALQERMKRLLAEAGESDRLIVERILQRQHIDAHPIRGMFITGRAHFPGGLGPTDLVG
jgi:hypothetical protein